MLTGELAPDDGKVTLGVNLQMATLDQRRETLDPDMSVRDTLTGGRGDSVFVGGQTRHVVGYMRDFLFAPEQAGTAVSALSGGERGRLTLARALAKPSNLLVLDEPTNDLDLETLDLLEEMIDDYPGTVLLVSHDRDFLDRTVSAVIVSEGGGRWNVYAGGYTDMVAQRGEGVTAKAVKAEPKAVREKAEAPSSPAPKRRLSFNDKHALETLPARIAALEAEIATLTKTIADPNLYARDRAAFDTASRRSGQGAGRSRRRGGRLAAAGGIARAGRGAVALLSFRSIPAERAEAGIHNHGLSAKPYRGYGFRARRLRRAPE